MSSFRTYDHARRLPAQAMSPIVDPAEWTRESLGPVDNFSYHLSDADRAAIVEAVSTARHNGVTVAEVSSENFSIRGAFAEILEDVRQELRRGRGLVMLRGFPIDQLDREGNAIGYLGLGSYLGKPMVQNMKGHILGHVKD